MPFFLIFIIIPLAEIIVFMNVSDVIGLGTALIMALMTAILGGAIVRYQGIHTLMAAQVNMRRGILPSRELFDGLCLVAAGAMLITPGFITDTIGFTLLIPPLRELLRQKLLRSGRFEMSGFQNNEPNGAPHHYQDPNIIEAEYETLDEKSSNDKDT
jgi:UPF0716 protein FxsA